MENTDVSENPQHIKPVLI